MCGDADAVVLVVGKTRKEPTCGVSRVLAPPRRAAAEPAETARASTFMLVEVTWKPSRSYSRRAVSLCPNTLRPMRRCPASRHSCIAASMIAWP